MRISDWSSDVCSSDLATIGNGCPVNVGAMATPLHAGTHGDAPLHYADDGAASADCDLAPYIGPCALLAVRHARGRVEVAALDWDAVEGATRVLLRTYERFPHRAWEIGSASCRERVCQ